MNTGQRDKSEHDCRPRWVYHSGEKLYVRTKKQAAREKLEITEAEMQQYNDYKDSKKIVSNWKTIHKKSTRIKEYSRKWPEVKQRERQKHITVPLAEDSYQEIERYISGQRLRRSSPAQKAYTTTINIFFQTLLSR